MKTKWSILCAAILFTSVHADDLNVFKNFDASKFTPEEMDKLRDMAKHVSDAAAKLEESQKKQAAALNKIAVLQMRKGGEKIPILTTSAGKTFKDVTVTKGTETELRIMHESGTAVVPLSDLPLDVQVRYGFNPDADASLDDAKRKVAALEYQKKIAAEKEDIRSRENATARAQKDQAAVAATGKHVRLRISQVLKSGHSLCYGSAVRRAVREDYETKGVQIINGSVLEPESKDLICVAGLPPSFVDHDTWSGVLFPCGSYTYTSVSGATRTVRKYAASVLSAQIEMAR